MQDRIIQKNNYTTRSRNIIKKVATQINKAVKVSRYLHGTIWENKPMATKNKMKIYKPVMKPILTYATETRTDTEGTKPEINNSEMKMGKGTNIEIKQYENNTKH